MLERRDRLVEAHLHLIPPAARRLAALFPPSFGADDLAGFGYVGLVEAATRYRPRAHADTPFSAFARQRIRGAMLDAVRRRNWFESTQAPLDTREAAAYFGISEGNLRGNIVAAHAGPPRPFRIKDAASKYVDAESGAGTIDEEIDRRRTLDLVLDAITWLPARERDVLERYYSPGQPTLDEIGAALGVSAGTIWKIHRRAITSVRARLTGGAVAK